MRNIKTVILSLAALIILMTDISVSAQSRDPERSVRSIRSISSHKEKISRPKNLQSKKPQLNKSADNKSLKIGVKKPQKSDSKDLLKNDSKVLKDGKGSSKGFGGGGGWFLPKISISDIVVKEHAGTAKINITLDETSYYPVKVDYKTVDGSAKKGKDYQYKKGKVTIPPGKSKGSFSVNIIDNKILDGDKSFNIKLSNAENSLIWDNTAEVAITDDDTPPATSSIHVNRKTPEKDYIPEELVEKVLVTGCLQAINIQFKGNANQIGYFSKGGSDFPLDEGIILSTGDVADAEGPNKEYNTSTGYEGAGDDDLHNISGTSTHDAAVLEFDFIPAGDVVQFRYIFASEEFLEYSCADYNDVFAFLMSGPQDENGHFPNKKNIALLEDGVTPVTINNIHDKGIYLSSDGGLYFERHRVYDSNGAYGRKNNRYYYEYNVVENPGCPAKNADLYVDNGQFQDWTEYYDGRILKKYIGNGGVSVEYDGYTKVLTATYANVTPCEKYHIKLAIADSGDDQWDSSVFLEAKSFSSNEVRVDNMIGEIEGDQEYMYEGCQGSFLRFTRQDDYDIDKEIKFDLDISGTATNKAGEGQDYVYTNADGSIIGNGEFPSKIIIPAGESYVDYYYKALGDEGMEPDETIKFRIDKCPCSHSDYYEKEVTIIDAPEINAVPSSAIKCDGGGNPTATISINLSEGLVASNYLFSFDNGATFGNENILTITSANADGSDLVGKTYHIVVKDKFGCNSMSDVTTIPPVVPINADAGGDRSMCYGTEIELHGGGGVYYEWSCNNPEGLAALSRTDISNPIVSGDIPVGVYTFTLHVQDRPGDNPICSGEESMILTVNKTPELTVYADDYQLCSGSSTHLHAQVSNVDIQSYEWNPSIGLDNNKIENPLFTPDATDEGSRSFTVTVKATNECSAHADLDNAITVFPTPKVELDPSSVICSDDKDGSDGSLILLVTGGTPDYQYLWDFDNSLNSPNATSLPSGNYQVIVTDSNNCSTTETYHINSKPTPRGIFHD